MWRTRRLPKRHDPVVTSPNAEHLRWWSRGLSIGTPVFVAAAILIRGWQDAGTLQLIAGIGLVAFLWAYVIARLSYRADMAPRLPLLLWINAGLLPLIATAMIMVSGGVLGPLSWLYVILTIGEARQHRHRGLVEAWLSWLLFCGLTFAQWHHRIPPELNSMLWDPAAVGPGKALQVVGLDLWYLAVAAAVTLWFRWVGAYERGLRHQHEEMARHTQALEKTRAAIETERWRIGQQVFQLDQAKRLLETEHKQWEAHRTQASQLLADKEAVLAGQLRQYEALRTELQLAQHQFEIERRTLDDQRHQLEESLRVWMHAREHSSETFN